MENFKKINLLSEFFYQFENLKKCPNELISNSKTADFDFVGEFSGL
jgi:hypothetical protein